LRKLSIADEASRLVKPGDVVLIDGGEVTAYLAEALAGQRDITVITNALAVIEALRPHPDIALIATGGLLRHESQTLTGPTTEIVLRELRADRLFLAVTGVSLDFGLSHTNLAEVTVKQAMIRAAREVILLADHTKFEQESVVQIAPISSVHKVITDNALPASTRLDLTKLGIEIIIART
jgi:DeoR/GlpR family transcriptional regulator of sugar metabolism